MGATDGEVLIDETDEFDDGTRLELYAVRSSDRPSGVKYTFQYYDPKDGATLLRYDNAHSDPDLGEHHRHGNERNPADLDRELEFVNVWDQLRKFLDEVEEIRND